MTTAFVLAGGGSLGAVAVGMLRELLSWGEAPSVVVMPGHERPRPLVMAVRCKHSARFCQRNFSRLGKTRGEWENEFDGLYDGLSYQ